MTKRIPKKERLLTPDSLTAEEVRRLTANLIDQLGGSSEHVAKLLLLCNALATSDDGEGLCAVGVTEACAAYMPSYTAKHDLHAQIAKLRGTNISVKVAT